MTEPSRQKRFAKDYINVSVVRKHYEEISQYLKELEGEFHNANMGKFYDVAAMKELKRIQERNSLWNRFNSQTLISNGFSKIGNTTYKRGDDIVSYTGTFWFYNDEKLTEENYLDKIFDKKKAKL